MPKKDRFSAEFNVNFIRFSLSHMYEVLNGLVPTRSIRTPDTLECTLMSANKFLSELPKRSKSNRAFVVRASEHAWNSPPEAIAIYFCVIIVRTCLY